MNYQDIMYDVCFGLPKYAWWVSHSEASQRARGITMGTLPNQFLFFQNSTRDLHGLGAAYLTQIALHKNQDSLNEDQQKLLYFAARLHDFGNPCFAHLSEPLMKNILGMDGESFITEVFNFYPKFGKDLQNSGVNPTDLVELLALKQMRPLSDLISGDIDTDNLDNVGRFAKVANIQIPDFRPEVLTSYFKWRNDEWVFQVKSEAEYHHLCLLIENWLIARQRVYDFIYGDPHLTRSSMLSSCLYYNKKSIAGLGKKFFLKTDNQALAYLEKPNYYSKNGEEFLTRLNKWQFVERIFTFETTKPSEKMLELEANWESRFLLAEEFASKNNLQPYEVTVYIGKERGGRKINKPVYLNDTRLEVVQPPVEVKHLFHVNVAPEKVFKSSNDAANEFLVDCIL